MSCGNDLIEFIIHRAKYLFFELIIELERRYERVSLMCKDRTY